MAIYKGLLIGLLIRQLAYFDMFHFLSTVFLVTAFEKIFVKFKNFSSVTMSIHMILNPRRVMLCADITRCDVHFRSLCHLTSIDGVRYENRLCRSLPACESQLHLVSSQSRKWFKTQMELICHKWSRSHYLS